MTFTATLLNYFKMIFHYSYTECFTDLGKQNFLMVVEPIFTSAPAALKNDAQFKSGQIRHENNHLALLI